MNHAIQKVAEWEIPESAIQSTGVVIAIFSVVFAVGAIVGLLQSYLCSYVVLFASALGVLGPIAYLSNNKKWPLVDTLFGLVGVVFCAYAITDLAPFVTKMI